ncbi:hypothetical protein SBV1_2110023 [Verrucomicrobia bacterium]|nr:hypothetical protein SBV1_2110023 [Verrucomicrobiota bacterium]
MFGNSLTLLLAWSQPGQNPETTQGFFWDTIPQEFARRLRVGQSQPRKLSGLLRSRGWLAQEPRQEPVPAGV